MKKTILALTMAAFVAPHAFAANDQDAGVKDETTVEHSSNPITGSKTTTETTERAMKKGKAHAKVKSVKKTKVKKDGTVEQSVDVEGDAANQ